MSLSNSTNFLIKSFSISFAIIAPIHATMGAVGLLILVDLFTGIWAAKKRKDPITSAALRRTVSKMVIYQICIMSAFALEHFILGDSLPVIKMVAGVIGSVELKSILENTNTITGLDIFKELLKKLGSSNDTLNPPPQ